MRILFLSALVPFPPVDGDRQRSFHLLKALAAQHEVHLCCFYRTPAEREQIKALAPFCASVTEVPMTSGEIRWNSLRAWTSDQPLNVAAFASRSMAHAVAQVVQAKNIEAVHAYRLRMAPYALNAEVPVRVLDYTDALTRYFEARLAQPAPFWKRWYLERETRCIRAYEAQVAARFQACAISSPTDRGALLAQGAKGRIEVVTNGVDTRALAPTPKLPKTKNVLFVGNMLYPPNQIGLSAFCHKSWPRVLAAEPQARFVVVGQAPVGTPEQWARTYPGAEFLGLVPDLTEHYHAARVAVCPLDVASGRQFKVIEAFAAGVPVVTTSVVAKNLDALSGQHLLTGNTPESTAEHILKLLRDDKTAMRLRKSARTYAEATYDWSQAASALLKVYASLAPKPASKNPQPRKKTTQAKRPRR